MSCWTAAIRSVRRSSARSPAEALGGVVEDLEPLAAGEADEVPAVLGSGVEDLVGHGDDAAALGQRPAERHAVAVGLHRADVDGREVRRLGDVGREAGGPQAGDEVVALGGQVGGDAGVEVVAEVEADGDGRLERGAVDVGEELLGRAGRGDERRPGRTASRSSSPWC